MNNTKELWKDIIDYEGIYQVSNLGRVKSVGREFLDRNSKKHCVRERILKSVDNDNGYLIVGLRKDGKNKMHRIHRLVALSFVPNLGNKKTVNHKNLIKYDNRADNLEWSTQSENVIHAYKYSKYDKHKKFNRVLARIIKDLVNNGLSDNGVAKLFGVRAPSIRYIRIKKPSYKF
jgi:hypothetical protein